MTEIPKERLTFADLRAANEARQAHWGGTENWTLTDWSNAVAGEVGAVRRPHQAVAESVRHLKLDGNGAGRGGGGIELAAVGEHVVDHRVADVLRQEFVHQ